MRLAQKLLIAVSVASLVFSAGCRSPQYADKGAAVGGVAGAIAGAALGDRSGNAATGAIVGTAVGALTGAAVGDSMDAELARRQALIEERTGRKMLGRVTNADVITLTVSGLSDDVITNHIRANGVAVPFTPRDIIELHDNGVSEKVINTMQQTASRPPPTVVPASRERPVIIEEHYHSPSPYWYRNPWHGRPSHGRRHPGFSWGVTFAN